VFFETWAAEHYPDPPSADRAWPTALASAANFAAAQARARTLSWDDRGLHEETPPVRGAGAGDAVEGEGSGGDGAASDGETEECVGSGGFRGGSGPGGASGLVARVVAGDAWGQSGTEIYDLDEARRQWTSTSPLHYRFPCPPPSPTFPPPARPTVCPEQFLGATDIQ